MNEYNILKMEVQIFGNSIFKFLAISTNAMYLKKSKRALVSSGLRYLSDSSYSNLLSS